MLPKYMAVQVVIFYSDLENKIKPTTFFKICMHFNHMNSVEHQHKHSSFLMSLAATVIFGSQFGSL